MGLIHDGRVEGFTLYSVKDGGETLYETPSRLVAETIAVVLTNERGYAMELCRESRTVVLPETKHTRLRRHGELPEDSYAPRPRKARYNPSEL